MAQEPIVLEEDGDLRSHLVPQGGLPDAAHHWLPSGKATIAGGLEGTVVLESFINIPHTGAPTLSTDVDSRTVANLKKWHALYI